VFQEAAKHPHYSREVLWEIQRSSVPNIEGDLMNNYQANLGQDQGQRIGSAVESERETMNLLINFSNVKNERSPATYHLWS
jgi:hypothetical protein